MILVKLWVIVKSPLENTLQFSRLLGFTMIYNVTQASTFTSRVAKIRKLLVNENYVKNMQTTKVAGKQSLKVAVPPWI